MSYGVPFVSPLPVPGVTPSPTFEAQLIAWAQENEGKLEQKIAGADIALVSGDFATHGIRTLELAVAGSSLIGATYDAATGYTTAAAGGNTVSKSLDVQPGQRIRDVSCHGRNTGVAWTVAVLRMAKLTQVLTVIGSATSGTVATTTEKKSVALTEVVLADFAYIVRFTAGAASDRCIGFSFGVDRP